MSISKTLSSKSGLKENKLKIYYDKSEMIPNTNPAHNKESEKTLPVDIGAVCPGTKAVHTISRRVAQGRQRLRRTGKLRKILRVSPRALRDYKNEGILPYIRMKGIILYRESDVEKMLKANEHKM